MNAAASIRASTPTWRLVVALSTIALLLCPPATSFARDAARTGGTQTEQGRSSQTALRTAGLLSRGAGYGSEDGSAAVRGLQVRLRALGFRPGPVDGFFGPLTEGAVQRFQRAHGLVADGLVGPLTREPLLARPADRESRPSGAARREHAAQKGAGPERQLPADAGPPRTPVPDTGGAPEPESSRGLAPSVAAGLGAVVTALLLGGLWMFGRRRSGTPAHHRAEPAVPSGNGVRLGLACAALLAVLAFGVAAGAMFAKQATSGDGETKDVRSTAALFEPSGADGAGLHRSRGLP